MQNKLAEFDNQKETFQFSEVTISSDTLQPNEVLVKQTLFSLDEYSYKAKKPLASLGEVVLVGSGVTWLQKGDKVLSLTKSNSFSNYRILGHDKLLKMPNFLPDDLILPLIVRGFIGHMLTVRVIIVRNNMQVIVDNIDSPTGAIIGWFARQRGGKVLGISHSKRAVPEESADWVLEGTNPNLSSAISQKLGGAAHIYFGGGLQFIDPKILKSSLVPMGVIVDSFAVMNNFTPDLVTSKSLFFTRPQLEDYKSLRSEMVLTINDLQARFQEYQPAITSESFNFNDIQLAFDAFGQSDKFILIKT